MSYKIWFTFTTDKPATNGQAFATAAEAEHSAISRMMRWYVPTGYEIRESEEPVNYRWDSESGDISMHKAA